MTQLGTLKEAFSRVYIRTNPNPYLGPDTNNLSNIPGINDGDIDDAIQNLYTIAPIQHTEMGDVANLYFDISAITNGINDARSTFTAREAVRNLLLYAPYKSNQQLFDLETITGISPVNTRLLGQDATIWFNMLDLPGLEDARSKRKIKVLFKPLYNKRSVTALTADAPLAVETVDGQATVSFDIKSLPDA